MAKQCGFCIAINHSTNDCTMSSEGNPDLPNRMKAEAAKVMTTHTLAQEETSDMRLTSTERSVANGMRGYVTIR